MTRAELDRLQALHRLEAGSVTQAEVARSLGLSTRQVKRLWRGYRAAGPSAVISRRRGRPSNRRLPEPLIATAMALIAEHYADFGPTLAAEQLVQRHGLAIGRETLRKAMLAHGLWTASHKRRRRPHPPRERRPCIGELVQGDGSPHAWFEERGPRCSLLLFVDDASSRIGAARFAPAETTEAYFALAKQYISEHGRPLAFYVDKLSVFTTTRPSEKDDLTQFARAMKDLEIELICANSPQAKGRVERINRTLQDRLVKELRLQNVSTIDEANAMLPAFIERYNAQFGVAPRSDQDAHRNIEGFDLESILAHIETRCVSTNLTFRYRSGLYLIEGYQAPRRLAHQRVTVREEAGGIVVEYRGARLNARQLPRQERAVVGAKELDPIVNRARLGPRIPDPKKQRQPAPNHPWRQPRITAPSAR